MTKFKVGDEVRCNATQTSHVDPTCIEEMVDMYDEIYVIKRIDPNGWIHLVDGRWVWHEMWLELAHIYEPLE